MKETASSSLIISHLLAIILLCICPTNARPVVKISESMLNFICSKTEDPAFCMQALKSDPRTATADLQGLAQVSIDLANATAAGAYPLIQTQLHQTKDPALKQQYTECLDSYEEAIDDIEFAREKWSSKDYIALNQAASACMTDATECQDAITTDDQAFSLPEETKKLFQLCKITLLISGSLMQTN
ncbi:pectinesterase inhibitor-like [Corylus avellana]|uniref:pectinesterase inhibitor-like n=1 Tax=Corylus avellana TaxID=13451 RepID=UPI00286C7090|nr:pectinesterase inhibitor-like [Corylus avellana]